MICLNVLLYVKDANDVMLVADALRRAGHLSRTEPGCLRWEAYHSANDPRRFMLVERWESQAALDAHRLAEAYTTIYAREVIPRVDREAHPSSLLE